jgi:hypothetical protein
MSFDAIQESRQIEQFRPRIHEPVID